MINLEQVSKIYPIGKENFYALDHVDLHIDRGEFVAIRGASGSGKSTMLNIIGCLDDCSEGSYYLDGVDVEKMSDGKKSAVRNAKVGFVFQDFALINNQTVLYNVMLPLLLNRTTPFSKVKPKAKAALEMVGLTDQAKKKANQLSGGQRQRVAIARAIVNDPGIILADEPTGQLDSQTGIQIMELLKSLNEQGITVLVVTHDDKVSAYAKRIITVSDGRIL
ncbi:MAG: ABC transporter ATP-binding protein [Oscillospiraceae bacterium]|nr:ABC transporter ATP-binding protein [Oscillospiraceae bacterium]